MLSCLRLMFMGRIVSAIRFDVCVHYLLCITAYNEE